MTSVKIRFSWITGQEDRTEHAVDDDAQSAAMDAGGWFEPACGQGFFAAGMEIEPRETCTMCWAFLRAREPMRGSDKRMSPPRWLSRLFCHRKRPANVGNDAASAEQSMSSGAHAPSADARRGTSDVAGDESAPTGDHRRRGRRAA